MQRVGKKASLDRLSFAADGCMYDDGYGWRKHEHADEGHMHMLHTYEYRDNDGGCDPVMYCDYDEQQEWVVDPNIASAKYLAARSKQKKTKTKSRARPPVRSSGSSSSSSSLSILRPATCLRYYNRDPRTRLLSSGLEDNLLLHVATFLDLRSVAGWSCTGRLANELLSSDALYCTSSSSLSGSSTCTGTCSNERDTLVLPCVKRLPYQLSIGATISSGGGGISRPRGLARTMAHEADRIFGHGGVRNVAVAVHIRCKEEVGSVHLLDQQGAIAVVTKTCDVELHWVGDNEWCQWCQWFQWFDEEGQGESYYQVVAQASPLRSAGFDVSRPNEDGGAPFDRHRGTQIHAFTCSAPILSRRCSRDHTAVQVAAV